ncbi:hypothetical protein FO519_007833 [Halicephalobus sp. NKZ332]|nr:hypothetical protein FO519_007833 [Halicephalobus sp. NKZ332]
MNNGRCVEGSKGRREKINNSKNQGSLENERICTVSGDRQSNVIVAPVDDYYLHENDDITVGRRYHKRLRDDLSMKLKKTGEVDVDYNLTELKSKYEKHKPDIRPLDQGLDHIQDYIMKKSEEMKTTDLDKILHGAQIVCSRRTLKLLALSPYSCKNWIFAIEEYNGILFLKELGKAESKENICDSEYFGYIFEKLIFATPEELLDEKDVISTYEKMYVATSVKLHTNTEDKKIKKQEQTINVFATASIDGLDRDGNYIEVKSGILSKGFSTLEWWLQSKFASIENIIHGIKSEEVDLNFAYKWRTEIAFGAIHQIFSALIMKYGSFVKKLKDKRKLKHQPQIVMKIEKGSKEVLLEENQKSTPILNSKFKERFQESKKKK